MPRFGEWCGQFFQATHSHIIFLLTSHLKVPLVVELVEPLGSKATVNRRTSTVPPLTRSEFVLTVLETGADVERKAMLPDVPTTLDRYFDLAEHLALRASLLIFLLLALYRVIEREWRKR